MMTKRQFTWPKTKALKWLQGGILCGLLVGCALPPKEPVIVKKPPPPKPIIIKKAPEVVKPQPAPYDFRIALLAPFSGQHKGIGEKVLNGANMALYENENSAGISLYPLDTEGTIDGATLATQQALKIKPHLIVGPVFSSSVDAASHVAKKENTKILALSNDLQVASPDVLVLGGHPETEMRVILEKAKSYGWHKILFYGPNNSYGQRLAGQFQDLGPFFPDIEVKTIFFSPITDVNTLTSSIRELTNFDQRKKNLENFLEKASEAWEDNQEFELVIPALMEKIDFLERPTIDASAMPEVQDEMLETYQKSHKARESLIEDMGRCLSHYVKQPMEEEEASLAMKKMLEAFATREVLGGVDFDAVVLPLQGGQLKMVSSLFDFYYASAPEVTLVGTSLWGLTEGLKQEPSLKKAWYLNSGQVFSYSQAIRYKEFFGEKPQPISALAYDAIDFAKDIYSLTGIKDRSFLEQRKFVGQSGTFHFYQNGSNARKTTFIQVGTQKRLDNFFSTSEVIHREILENISEEKTEIIQSADSKVSVAETLKNMCGLVN
ncbi:MAG: penicillin-binding protein activator [Rhodospirillales bacterium]|nr:penicillin-binding protein activator [Rhodospirillales bacterium]